MHKPRHFVGPLPAAPMVAAGLYHMNLEKSSSAFSPKPNHDSNQRCALHQAGETEIDPAPLDKENVWLGRNLETSSARKRSIPFHRLPLEDQLHPSTDNEGRLVYCGDCLKVGSKDPLPFTLQYEQDDEIKVM